MKFRQLGRSGLVVSEVGLGCNNFGGRCDFERTKEVVHGARDLGITLFDTADVYGGDGISETFLGKLIPEFRDEIVLATKFGVPRGKNKSAGASRRYIKLAVESSLSRLNTDRIDLYQLHEPDPHTPIDETLSALDDLVKQGKVLYIGSSNFSSWQIAQADYVARSLGVARFISAQNEYSLIQREAERELIPAAREFGVGILPYYPLAAGLLTGKFKRNEAPPAGTRLANKPEQLESANFDLVESLDRFASERGLSLLDLAFGYLLFEEQVSSVIAGATSKAQLVANVKTQERSLSAADYQALKALLANFL